MEHTRRFTSTNPEDVSREYSRLFTIKMLMIAGQGKLVKLWTQLMNEGYSGLSNIAFGIMVMSPDVSKVGPVSSLYTTVLSDQQIDEHLCYLVSITVTYFLSSVRNFPSSHLKLGIHGDQTWYSCPLHQLHDQDETWFLFVTLFS